MTALLAVGLLFGVFAPVPGVNAAPTALQISKTADKGTVNAGEQIGYTIAVTNSGNHPTNAIVSDTLPASPGTSWTVSSPASGCGISSGTLTCVLRIPAGSSSTVHIVSPTTTATCGTVTNTASVSAGGAGTVTSSPATIQVNCLPDLIVQSITMTAPQYPAFDYAVTVKNQGGSAANLTGVTVQGYYSPTADGWGGTNTPACGTSFTSGTLPPGGTATINVFGCPATPAPGDAYLVVKVDSGDVVAESDETNNIGSHAIPVFTASLTDDGACSFTTTATFSNIDVDHVYGFWYVDGSYIFTTEAPGIGPNGGTLTGNTAVMKAGPMYPRSEPHPWQVLVQFYDQGAFVAQMYTNLDAPFCGGSPGP
jgi:uncharacterized repeat protein (TIGR01451 family)